MIRRSLLPLLVTAALLPAAAQAKPATGSRATVDFTVTTTQPGTSAGFTYTASFRNPDNPAADPRPLRRLVIRGAEGTAIDGSRTPSRHRS